MPDVLAVQLTAPDGEALGVEWISESEWRLDGVLDWAAVSALRVLRAGLGDDDAVAVVALRPAEAAGHGDEIVAATLVEAGTQRDAEALLSVEYAGDGTPRRVGLELSVAGGEIPIRVAADAIDSSASDEDGRHTVRATLAVRRDGRRSEGVLEIVTAA